MALQAAVENLTKKRKRRKEKDLHENGRERQSKNRTSKPKGKKQNPPKPSWMFQRPPEEEIHKPRKWNGNDWWYCHPDTGGKCDGKYRQHKPAECEGRAFGNRFNRNNGNETNNKGQAEEADKRLKVAEALTTVVNDESDGNSSEGYKS